MCIRDRASAGLSRALAPPRRLLSQHGELRLQRLLHLLVVCCLERLLEQHGNAGWRSAPSFA
eukprot:6201641-Pyramimonas_sp.AAC.1